MSDSEPLLRARRWALCLGALALASSAALVFVLLRARGADGSAGPGPVSVVRGGDAERPSGEALDVAMRAAIDAMVAEARGIMDSHPDPDVGRVLQPRLQGAVYRGAPVSSNDDGLRELPIARPKPDGRTRIVLLGDSHLFGWGVASNRRVGRLLQQDLRRELPNRDLEVLSVAVPSWNLRAQCAYLRRQAALLQADLVVVHVCDNDLDDNLDVRGFGSLASFSSQRRAQADAIVWRNMPLAELGAERGNPLLLGLDEESRGRWRAAVDDVARLRDAVTAAGGRTWLLMNMGVHNALARRLLVEPLGDVPAVWIAPRFARDPENRLGERDVHWSELGHGRVAEQLYGALMEWQPLAGLRIPEREPALKAWRQLQRQGRFQAESAVDVSELWPLDEALGELTPGAGAPWPGARQVYGGVDAQGRLGPSASLVLPVGVAGEVLVELAGLGRVDLPRVGLELRLDGVVVGGAEVAHDVAEATPVVVRANLPPASRNETLVTLTLTSDDWVHAADDLRHAVSARLLRVRSR